MSAILEAAYADFHKSHFRERDPVSLVHVYPDPKDREVAAFLVALLSYGNVQTILSSARKILSVLGDSPYKKLKESSGDIGFPGFRHRFTTGDDLSIIAFWVGQALQQSGSLENFFIANEPAEEKPMRELLSRFVHRLSETPLPKRLQTLRKDRERSLKYLLSDPERGSACKRLNMYLRWMVRKSDGIDLGLWKGIATSQLVLPIDTHLLQTLRALRWTRSQQATWKVAESATERLREYSPTDPVRYDFALCHLSMSGGNIRNYLKSQRNA